VVVGSDEKTQAEMVDMIIFNKKRFPDKWTNIPADKLRENLLKSFKEFSDKWYLKYAEKEVDKEKNMYEFWIKDMYNSVEADIHNDRSTSDKFMKWVFEILTKDMRKVGADNFKSYIKKKYGNF